jgi:hypothetical protein
MVAWEGNFDSSNYWYTDTRVRQGYMSTNYKKGFRYFPVRKDLSKNPSAIQFPETVTPNRSGEAELPEYQWDSEENEKQQEEFERDQEEFEEDRERQQTQPPVVTGGNVAKSGGGSGSVGLVETMLFLLIIVNGFTSGQFKGLWGLITLQGGASPQQFRQGFVVLGGELVLLIILSLASRSSDDAKKVVLAIVGTLWLGWLFHNRAVIASFAALVQPAGPTVKKGGKLTTA